MKLSDIIAEAIMDILEEEGGTAQIQRNELAGRIGCVPSQISYVITSRFTPEQGFYVESKRGGGGFIRIERVGGDGTPALMHLINSIGDTIDEQSLRAILKNLVHSELITVYMAKLILAATCDTTLKLLEIERRGEIRARILKNMLLNI